MDKRVLIVVAAFLLLLVGFGSQAYDRAQDVIDDLTNVTGEIDGIIGDTDELTNVTDCGGYDVMTNTTGEGFDLLTNTTEGEG